MLKEYEEMKEANQIFKDPIKFIVDFSLFTKQCYRIVWSVQKIQKVRIQKLQKEKTGRIMLLPKDAVSDSKKTKFMK